MKIIPCVIFSCYYPIHVLHTLIVLHYLQINEKSSMLIDLHNTNNYILVPFEINRVVWSALFFVFYMIHFSLSTVTKVWVTFTTNCAILMATYRTHKKISHNRGQWASEIIIICSLTLLQAWYFKEATEAIASVAPCHCLGALEMLQ